MKKLSRETIEKLEWLKARLRKYPHRYNQNFPCGTQACLAGFCFPRMIGSRSVTISMWRARAAYNKLPHALLASWTEWLGISPPSAIKLFAAEWWAEADKFNRVAADTPKQAAEKACQRIDLFIQSGGAQ